MRTPFENLILFFKGVAMGAADVVPGVSGGTIALISGIYEELIVFNLVNITSCLPKLYYLLHTNICILNLEIERYRF